MREPACLYFGDKQIVESRESKTLDKSIKTAPTSLFCSSDLFQFSISLIKTCMVWAVWFTICWDKIRKKCFNIRSKITVNKYFINFLKKIKNTYGS